MHTNRNFFDCVGDACPSNSSPRISEIATYKKEPAANDSRIIETTTPAVPVSTSSARAPINTPTGVIVEYAAIEMRVSFSLRPVFRMATLSVNASAQMCVVIAKNTANAPPKVATTPSADPDVMLSMPKITNKIQGNCFDW